MASLASAHAGAAVAVITRMGRGATLYLIGGTVSVVRPGAVMTVLHDGSILHAEPHATVEYAETARRMGYGKDVRRMNAQHDLTHCLVAHWLGLRESPVLRALANDTWRDDPDGRLALEEMAVESVCRLALAWGVDLETVAGSV